MQSNLESATYNAYDFKLPPSKAERKLQEIDEILQGNELQLKQEQHNQSGIPVMTIARFLDISTKIRRIIRRK